MGGGKIRDRGGEGGDGGRRDWGWGDETVRTGRGWGSNLPIDLSFTNPPKSASSSILSLGSLRRTAASQRCCETV